MNEFSLKIMNAEYISTSLYNKIKEENPNLIPPNFNLDSYNDNIIEKDYLKYKSYFENMYKGIDNNIHLDKEQIKAILTDEDYSLIIAGAGTGKTTTMASKVKYLVDIKGVNPSKIAVMSFTKKATEELETRIKIDFGIPANITTFHSLGFSYIRAIFSTHKCYVVDNELRNKIFIDFFKEKIFPFKEKIKEIMQIFGPDKTGYQWLFGSYFKDNYEKYSSFDAYFEDYKKSKIAEIPNLPQFVEEKILADINDDENIKTIKGEIVKSKGEALIANFLFRNGIEYEYERIYPELMRDRKTYKPDFTLELGGSPVYLEYFGLSNYDNNSELELSRYEKIRHEKEKYHKEHHTNFIALDSRKGENFMQKLKEELLKLGFRVKPKTYSEIYDQMLSNNPTSTIYPFKDLLYNLIDNLKSSPRKSDYLNISRNFIAANPKEVQELMNKQFDYINEFYLYYQNKLFNDTEKYGFDFSDMFYYALKYMENLNENNLKFDYIIVDEYQDISKERYLFTKKISDINGSKIVAVGDDWQSIFAFAGSKIKYIYNFEKYFKNAKLLKITKTYRNSQELIKYSGDFIMKNKDQIRKDLVSDKSIINPIRFIKYKDGFEKEVLKKLIIKIHQENPTHKIMILARTNEMIKDLFREDEFEDALNTKINFVGYEDINLDGMTMHKSKGLTCDEVILIGLNKSFPSKTRDSFWLKAIFKDQVESESIPYAEERRLFYVALTRTKNYVYLLVNEDTNKVSPFVSELALIMKEKYEYQNN